VTDSDDPNEQTTRDTGFANTAMVVDTTVIAAYSTVLSRGRSEAVQRLHLQTWHLQQLLPRATLATNAS
jgi:hypothetical protein